MAQIYCVANQKGGVGKTTTSVNLAAALARIGQRVLLVDLDPQGNATMGCGVDKRALQQSVYDVLLGQCPAVQALVSSPAADFQVLGANRELAGAEIEMVELPRREHRLRDALADLQDQFDFILMDCPPSLGLLTLNGLCAAHGVIVPMLCEYYALEGLTDLVNTIKQVHANFNRDLKIIGILRVMFDARVTLQQQVSEELKQHFGGKVFDTLIPRNVRLAEAPSHGLPGVVYDPSAKGSKAFVQFAQELSQRRPGQPRAAAAAPQAQPEQGPGQEQGEPQPPGQQAAGDEHKPSPPPASKPETAGVPLGLRKPSASS
ncbi:chromosome partitioning protein [Vandammella animalimorsus]|uniref:Chromosome partitioning protein n=1 Tax=Vandammella animalimorsus TaxID=2029117 RepID=A0A2A2AMD0_9BURK|nr:ParA family protein [Vandammella animalimorsus]PAT39745.1 chromosome partitioning protein [Vandammella animalimorsus]